MKKLLLVITTLSLLAVSLLVPTYASSSWTVKGVKQYFNFEGGTDETFVIPTDIMNGHSSNHLLPSGYYSLKLLDSNGGLLYDFVKDYGVDPTYDLSFDILVTGSSFAIFFNDYAMNVVDSLPKGTHYKLEALVPFVDKVPVIGGETAFVTNFDNPVTETEIRSHINAYDEVDGDISHLIKVDSSTYNPANIALGQFEINYSVTDSNGNKATLKVHVLVKDITAPSMTLGSWTQNISYTKTLDVEALKNTITKTDNVDSSANITVTVSSNTYTSNKTKVGTYQIGFEAKDRSNNKSSKIYTVNVIDDVAPIASYQPVIFKPATSMMTLANIKADITAVDIIDGNVIDSLIVIRDEFTGFGNKVGSYEIEFQVKDKSNNKANFIVTVEVTDNIAPVFMVTPGQFIRVQDIVTLTHQDFVDILTVTRQLKMVAGTTFKMINNEYEGNENNPGIYAVSMKFDSPTGESVIKSFGVEVLKSEGVDGVIEDATDWYNDVLVYIKANPLQTGLILVGSILALTGLVVLLNSANGHKINKSKYDKYKRR